MKLSMVVYAGMFLVASALLAAGAWTGTPVACSTIEACNYSLAPTGAVELQWNGGGQVFLPGDTHWSYFSAGTYNPTITDEGPGPVINSELYHVVGDFQGYDTSQAANFMGHVDDFVYTYYCGGGKGGSKLCHKPESGSVTVTLE